MMELAANMGTYDEYGSDKRRRQYRMRDHEFYGAIHVAGSRYAHAVKVRVISARKFRKISSLPEEKWEKIEIATSRYLM